MNAKKTPNLGQVWKSNKDGREVEIEDLYSRFAVVRNTETGKVTTMDQATLNRDGASGWTYVRG